jgi:hypothetical protein
LAASSAFFGASLFLATSIAKSPGFVFSSAFPQARDDSRLMLAQLAKQIRIALSPDRDNKPPILDGEPEAVLRKPAGQSKRQKRTHDWIKLGARP